jgi:DNA-binding CsgD family transcriptional regulator
MLDAVGELYKPVRPQRQIAHFSDILRTLIPGDFHGVSVVVRPNRLDRRGRRDTALFPVPEHWKSLAEIFAKQYATFPLRPIRESGNLYPPLALSDVASRQKIESLEIYHDYYRVLGVVDDLSANFGTLRHRVCLAILRGRRGFSAQDRAILAVLCPHFERAYRYARASFRGVDGSNGVAPALESTGVLEDPDSSPQLLRTLGLSKREAEVLYWVATGKSGPVISTILGITHDTVRAHLKGIFAKLGVENRLSAALRALQVLRSGQV